MQSSGQGTSRWVRALPELPCCVRGTTLPTRRRFVSRCCTRERGGSTFGCVGGGRASKRAAQHCANALLPTPARLLPRGVLQCYAGELPELEGLAAQFDGVYISGSHYSAYEGGWRAVLGRRGRGRGAAAAAAAAARNGWVSGGYMGGGAAAAAPTHPAQPRSRVRVQPCHGFASSRTGCALRWLHLRLQEGAHDSWASALAAKCLLRVRGGR